MKLQKFGRTPLWYLTAAAAALYGLVIAFGPAEIRELWTLIGSLVIGAMIIAFLIIPFFIWLGRGLSGQYQDQPSMWLDPLPNPPRER